MMNHNPVFPNIPAEIIEAGGKAVGTLIRMWGDNQANAGNDDISHAVLAATWNLIWAKAQLSAAETVFQELCSPGYNPATCRICETVQLLREDAAAMELAYRTSKEND